jgi:hypothetical protein
MLSNVSSPLLAIHIIVAIGKNIGQKQAANQATPAGTVRFLFFCL